MPRKKLTFEDGLEQLRSTVQQLEQGEMTLEESFAAYEDAVKLQKSLQEILDAGDKRIRVLTDEGERELSETETDNGD